MLDRTLIFVKDVLDSYLRQNLTVSDSLVVLNSLRDSEDSSFQKNQNRLVMTLVNIEYDSARPYYNMKSQSLINKTPPQFFNLTVLFAANFDDYIESLKVISNVILYFQANPIFQRSSYPQMPDEQNLLEIEIENSSEAKSFELWHALGAHYMPSVLYKIRRLTMDSRQIAGFQPQTRQATVEIGQ